MDTDSSACPQRRHTERHGNAVIAMTMHLTAPDLAAIDDDAVRGWLAFDAQRQQTIRHHLNAIRLLDSQLFCTTQHRATVGTGSSHEQYRKLINGQRNQLFRDLDTLQFSRTHTQISHWLAADFTLVFQ